MIITIDTNEKTLEISSEIKFQELADFVSLFGLQEYKIRIATTKEYISYPISFPSNKPEPFQPWVTYNTHT